MGQHGRPLASTVGLEAVRRSRQVHAGLADDLLNSAAAQFIPAATAGALLTLVLEISSPQNLWMLPGLWQITLSLGVFAACRSLPRAVLLIAVWYLATGLLCLTFVKGEHAFSLLAMALPFSVGQFLSALLVKPNFGDWDVR